MTFIDLIEINLEWNSSNIKLINIALCKGPQVHEFVICTSCIHFFVVVV